MNNEFIDENNISSGSSVLGSDDLYNLRDSGNEEEEQTTTEGSSEIDYSSLLTDLDTDVNTISTQIDNLNDNICILNENVKVCTGLLFVIVVLVGIKFIYHILTSILGLGSL